MEPPAAPLETPAPPSLLDRWHAIPLYWRIIGGMVLGVIVGMILGAPAVASQIGKYGAHAGQLAIPSKLVLRVLGALAPMLIFLAIVQALMSAKLPPGTGKRLIRLLMLNTVVAILIGLLVANVVRPGRFSKLEVAGAEGSHITEMAEQDMLSKFLENVPKSLLGPFSDNGSVIGVILIALAFGLGLRKVEEHGPVKHLVDLALKTMIVVLHWVIDVVPIAVFGLVASIVGEQGFSAFHALGMFVFAVLLALFLQACYYLLRVRLGTWVSPLKLLTACRDALVMAFSTGSSTITMPVTFDRLKNKVGLRERSASLGALVGSNFNNDGTALYEAMAALFISQMLAVTHPEYALSLQQQVFVVITSVVASVGAAGIPEAGLVTMTLVFHAVKLPPVYIGLLLPVDWFLDRCRTVINVMGDMNVSCMIDGKTRETPEEAAAANAGAQAELTGAASAA